MKPVKLSANIFKLLCSNKAVAFKKLHPGFLLILLFPFLFQTTLQAQSVNVTNVTTTPVCAGFDVTVTFDAQNGSGTPKAYDNNTTFLIYLSNASGGSYAQISSFSTTGQSYSSGNGAITSGIQRTVTIPSNTGTGSGYMISIGSTSPSFDASSGAGASAAFTVTVTPTITGTTPASRCGTGTLSLGATASAGTLNWYAASTGGSSLGTGTSFTTPSISTTTSYWVGATNGGCTTAARTPVTATVNPAPTITGTTPASRCATGTLSLGATASAGIINWYAASTGGASLGTGTSFTTPSISSTTSYWVDATNGGCTTASRTQVIATVNAIPTITGTTPASRCATGTVNLGATASAGTINWYAASTGGSSLGTGISFTTPSISSTTSYWVDAVNGGCTTASRTQVIATVNTTPTITGTTPASRCGTGTLNLGATASAGTINWYAASTGGSSLGTGISFTTPSISSTTSYWVDATNGGCTTASRTQVIATVNTTPTITGTTPASRCGTGTVNLGATASAGTINWYAASTGGSSLGTGISFTTPSISSTTSYWVDATNGGCTTASRTQVIATVNAIPTITGTTPASRCATGTVSLGATASAGTINWYAASTGGASLGTGTSFTTPSISTTTSYWVDATNGGCTTASRTEVIATVNSIPSITGTTPASSCGTGTVSLGATASAGTINWYAASTGGASLGTGTSFTTPSISTTTSYWVDATIGGCTTVSRTQVIATVNAYPSITGTTAGSRCGTGTVTLSATASAGTINWHSAATGPAFLASGASFTSQSISATTTYWVDATANGCTTTSKTAVIATINTIPSITGTTPASRCGTGTVNLGATASAGTINWYAAATGGASLGTGTSFTTPSISSTTTYYADATVSGCTTGSRTALTATVNQTIAGTVAGSQSVCYNTQPTVALTLSGHNGAVVKWQRSGTADFSAASDITNTTTSLSAAAMGVLTATTYFRAVVKDGVCAQDYAAHATVTVLNTNEWTGAIDTDWNNAGNWSCYVPVGANDIIIASGLTNYPQLNDGANGNVKNITIQTGATLTISDNILKVSGSITNNGTFDLSNGSLELNGAMAQTIPASLFAANAIKELDINNDVSVTLAGELKLTGTLRVSKGTFYTGDFLHLKSTAVRTARIAEMPADGSGNATSFINGKVTIERYLPARKAWRLVSAPVYSGAAPSINAAWQEGVTTASGSPNINPGYGVFIQGGTVANGFDQGATSAASIKVYSNAANNFVALPATPGTNAAITSYPGYFLYVRGDRGINLLAGNAAATTEATLRVKGNINTGKITTAVNATNYTVLGNPYPSAIDFGTIAKTNVKNGFYVWDPKLAGAFGLGAYVTFSWNNATSSYDATTSASALSQYIQSGEAIIIESADGVNPGSVTIKESDKTDNGSDQVFGRYAGPPQRVRVNLYAVNADNTSSLLDAVLTTYDDANSNAIDNEDAKKLNGGSENIGIKRGATMLAIERRKTITDKDTSFLNLYQMKIASYRLEIIADKLDANKTVAVIKDSYSNTINNMLLNPNGITVIPFSINSDPASYAIGRFSIVFTSDAGVALPVTFKTVKATKQQKEVWVEWTTENELNVKHYEVERSVDGTDFIKINTSVATAANGGNAAYKFADLNPSNGNNFYRIRSVDLDGKASYSMIVKLLMLTEKSAPSVVVYPNPVTGNTVSLQMNNLARGIYTLQLFNNNGQLVATKTVQQNGSAAVESFDIKENFASGKYELILKGEGIQLSTPVIKR